MVRGSILGMCHVFNLKSFQIISSAEYLLFGFFLLPFVLNSVEPK